LYFKFIKDKNYKIKKMDKSKAQNTKNSGSKIKEEQIINPFEKKIKRIKEEMEIL
jgi:hypothetical protein